MTQSEAAKYIRESLLQGNSEDQIKRVLRISDVSEDEINLAFNAVRAAMGLKTEPVSEPKQESPKTPEQIAKEKSDQENLNQAALEAAPFVMPSVESKKQEPAWHKILIKVILLFLFLFVIAGAGSYGVYYAQSHSLWLFDRPPFTADTLAQALGKNISNLKSLSYDGNIVVKTEAENPASPVIPTVDYGSGFNFLTANLGIGSTTDEFVVNMKFSGLAVLGNRPQNASVALKLTSSSLDTNTNLSLQFVRKNGNHYLVFDDVPTVSTLLPYQENFTRLKGQWILLTSADLANQDLPSGLLSIAKDLPKYEYGNYYEPIVDLLEKAFSEKVIYASGEPVKTTCGELTCYQYNLTVSKTYLPQFISEIVAYYNDKIVDQHKVALPDNLAEFLDSSGYNDLFIKLQKSSTLNLYVDQQGEPLRLTGKISFVPEPLAANKKQLTISTDITFTDQNTDAAVIAPSRSITLHQAALNFQNFSEDEYALRQQLNKVETIRAELANYVMANKDYPKTFAVLDAWLNGTSGPIASSTDEEEATSTVLATSTPRYPEPIVNYTKKSHGYELGYLIRLTPYNPQASALANLIVDVPNKKMLIISGQNTATEKTRSLEADKANKQDANRDKLPDAFENYTGQASNSATGTTSSSTL